MMAKANVGIPKDKWKPPEGYKSALGRARDADRKRAQKVSALTTEAEDTASESDVSDSDSINFSIKVMKPVKNGTPLTKAYSAAAARSNEKDQYPTSNKFDVLSCESDHDVMDSLGSWAKIKSTEPQSVRKLKSKMCAIKEVKDIRKLEGKLASMSLDGGRLSRSVERVLKEMRIECDNNELLVMMDSGSFTHAINAETHLPGHEILPPSPKESRRKAETACGGILNIKGVVKVAAEVNDHSLDVKFCHMDVNTPILSVCRLVKDGYEIFICKGGGFIRHADTGKLLYFKEHQGVYYMKMKIKEAGFGRPRM